MTDAAEPGSTEERIELLQLLLDAQANPGSYPIPDRLHEPMTKYDALIITAITAQFCSEITASLSQMDGHTLNSLEAVSRAIQQVRQLTHQLDRLAVGVEMPKHTDGGTDD